MAWWDSQCELTTMHLITLAITSWAVKWATRCHPANQWDLPSPSLQHKTHCVPDRRNRERLSHELHKLLRSQLANLLTRWCRPSHSSNLTKWRSSSRRSKSWSQRWPMADYHQALKSLQHLLKLRSTIRLSSTISLSLWAMLQPHQSILLCVRILSQSSREARLWPLMTKCFAQSLSKTLMLLKVHLLRIKPTQRSKLLSL